jgi:hypothetical protein
MMVKFVAKIKTELRINLVIFTRKKIRKHLILLSFLGINKMIDSCDFFKKSSPVLVAVINFETFL